ITVNATDSLGNSATPETIAVNATTSLAIEVPSGQTVAVDTATPISGVSLVESGATSTETFTVTLSDATGVLSASGGTWNSETHTLTIGGTLSQINADLATLSDTETQAGNDTITVNATDSLGNSATPETIAVATTGIPVITVPEGTQAVAID